jgi:hypothetical protein
VIQEIDILKSEVGDKDEYKVKYAEAHRSVGLMEFKIIELNDINRRGAEKQSRLSE